MFFKKLKCLNIFLSVLLVSSQALAADLSGEHFYLPKAVSSNPLPLVPVSIAQDKLRVPLKPRGLIIPIDLELDRMEAVQNALAVENALDEAERIPLSEKTAVIQEPKKTVVIQEPRKVFKQVITPTQETQTVSLSEIIASSPIKPGVRIIHKSALIIQGKNIEKFLAMDEGFINVQKIDSDHIKIEALKYGGTFLNVWDDAGRRTIYVGIIFPQAEDSLTVSTLEQEEHERPFRFAYSNDWNTYYYAPKGEDLKRQSYNFIQHFSLEGQSPYGYLDTSLTENNFNGLSEVSYYTLGLNSIPVEGTSQFNLRLFDSHRGLSALTMPGTRLRGYFADINIWDNLLGFSYSQGQKKSVFNFLSQTGSKSVESYIEGFKLTLFPTDYNNQLSFNLARGYGAQHEDNLAKKSYSVDARKKIANVYLNGEYAYTSDQRYASLGGLKWQQGPFVTAFNLRNINKNFTTVSGLPSNQGEMGVTWSTGYENGEISGQAALDVNRQYLFFNPNNPNALNYDFFSHWRVPLIRNFWSDTNFNYIHTPGEVSPRRSTSLDQRISRAINFLGFKNTNVYLGGALQRTRYELSKASAYNRYTASSGIQVPLSSRLSVYANYDDSWVREIESGNRSNPSVLSTGFYYNRQLTDKLSTNSDFFYRKEMGVKGTSSFLSGEDSAGVSLGFAYNPANDVNFFVDGRTRKVWSLVEGNTSYIDLDVRFGLRMSFDVFKRGWDPNGYVRGRVYKDRNADGHFQNTDQGIAGVKVKAYNREAVTDQNGVYRMKIKAKSVSVAPDTSTIPSGVVFSTPTARTVKIRQWGTSNVDFGLSSQTGVYGLVFVDKNNNSIPDATDQFVKSVKIVLDKKHTSVSDSQGAFYFRNIADGVHSVKIDINSLPIQMIPQVKLDHEIKVTEGTTYLFHVPVKIKENKE